MKIFTSDMKTFTKFIFGFFLQLCLLAGIQAQDLIITGVIDGPLPGGTPKAIELYVFNDVPDLSIYGVESANNGGGSAFAPEFVLSGSATAGSFLYIATESTQFSNWFGFAPDFVSGAASINGNDAVLLYLNGGVIDVFGDPDMSGTGEPWEYEDGWAYRNDDTYQDNPFDINNWYFSGTDALDGETSNATAQTPFPIGTYMPPAAGSPPPITVYARAACQTLAGVDVAPGTYVIIVDSIRGGINADYNIGLENDPGSFSSNDGDTPVMFGPFNHSGLDVGGAVQVLEADQSGVIVSFTDVPEVLCGYGNDAAFCSNELANPNSPYQGAIIAQSVPGTFAAGGSTGQIQQYVLVNSNNEIVAVNMVGLFTALEDGNYTVWAINYLQDEAALIEGYLIPGELFTPIEDGFLNDDGPLADACYTLCGPASYTVDCPALIDLALYKTLSNGQAYAVAPGDTVSFDINIVNQGLLHADNICIADHLPAALLFDAGLNAGWSYTPGGGGSGSGSGTAQACLEVGSNFPGLALPPGGLAPGQTFTVSIQLIVSQNAVNLPGPFENLAEIYSATDTLNMPVDDIDSNYDLNPNNDNFLVDNDIDGNGLLGDDEDDHDPAYISLLQFDLALYQVLAPGQSENVAPGDTVDFKIYVLNQGGITADDIVIVDSIPDGFIFDASLNPGWSFQAGSSNVVENTLSVGSGLNAPGLCPYNNNVTFVPDFVGPWAISNWFDDSSVNSNGSTDTSNDPTGITLNGSDGGGSGLAQERFCIVAPVDGAIIFDYHYEEFDVASSSFDPFGYSIDGTFSQLTQNGLQGVQNGAVTPDAGVIQVTAGQEFCFEQRATDNVLGPANTDIFNFAVSNDKLNFVAACISLVVDPSAVNAGDKLTNFAEIADAVDENGNPQTDVDSEPDNNFSNDIYLQDNEVNGNGLGGEDEDDSDPACVYVKAFDLALIKTVPDSNTSAAIGDTIPYTIKVTNQGEIIAGTIEICDSFSSGLTFDVGLNPDWSFVPGSGTACILLSSGSGGALGMRGLEPGEMVTVTMNLIVNSGANVVDGEVNIAEISTASDEHGLAQEDVDSDPDNNFSNDAGGNPGGNSDDVTGGDGTGTPGDNNPDTDEDDSDPALITILPFDLALYNVLAPGQSENVALGDTVDFKIYVLNQGQVVADNITIIDSIPEGMIFDPAINPGWTDLGNGLVEYTFATGSGGVLGSEGLCPYQSGSGSGSGQLVQDFTGVYDVLNWFESNTTFGGDTDLGNAPSSITLTSPNSNSGGFQNFCINVPSTGTIAFDWTYNTFDQDGSSFDPSGYSLNGTFNQLTTNGSFATQTGMEEVPVQAGDEFCFSQQATDGALGSGVTTYSNFSANSAKVNYVAACLSLIVDPNLDPSIVKFNDWAEISGATNGNGVVQNDYDSTPDEDLLNDIYLQDNEVSGNGLGGEDEDDHDNACAFIAPFDLALTKTLADPSQSTVTIGDTVTYNIKVTNQGDVPASFIEVCDSIPGGLTFDAGLNPNWNGSTGSGVVCFGLETGSGTANVSGSGAVLSSRGLQPDSMVTVTISLIVNSSASNNTGSGSNLVNIAEIVQGLNDNDVDGGDQDSDPDNNFSNDGGGNPGTGSDNVTGGDGSGAPGDTDPFTDEDDSDPEEISIAPFDLALYNILAPGQSDQVALGDTVGFKIYVLNQGEVIADNITIIDSIPEGMIFDPAINPGWTQIDDNFIEFLFSTGATGSGTLMGEGLCPYGAGSGSGSAQSVQDFTGVYDVLNWSENNTAPGGNTDLGNAPSSITMTSPNVGVGGAQNFCISAPNSGTINFDWTYNTFDVDGSSFDPFGYSVDGVFTQLSLDGSFATQTGTEEVPIEAGQEFCFSAQATDGVAGSAVTTISNFSASGGKVNYVAACLNLIVDPNLDPSIVKFNDWAEISSATNNNGIPQADIDSSPDEDLENDIYLQDNEVSGNGLGGEDEDDHDNACAFIAPFDLALTKTLADPSQSTVTIGDTVTYNIEVTNQGDVVANFIEVCDLVPAGLTFDAGLNPNWSGGATGSGTIVCFGLETGSGTANVSGSGAVLSSRGLQPDSMVTVTITLIVNETATNGNLVNLAEIVQGLNHNDVDGGDQDSDPDSDFTNDAGGNPGTASDNVTGGDGSGAPGDTDPFTDEDDSDPEQISLAPFDLALYKVLKGGQSYKVTLGDTVGFEIVVLNQGGVTANNITIVDSIPDGFIFDPNINPGWSTGSGANLVEYTFSVDNEDFDAPGLCPLGGGGSGSGTGLISNFTGPWDIGNWQEVYESNNVGGSVSYVGNTSITLTSSNGGPSSGYNYPDGDDNATKLCITAPEDAILTFDWSHDGTDDGAFYEPFGYTIDDEPFVLTDPNVGPLQSGVNGCGSGAVMVEAGQEFCFEQWATDNCCGSGTGTIMNFSYEACDKVNYVSACLNLIVDPNATQASNFTNWAEISEAENENGVVMDDIDSNADGDLTNDNYLQDNEVSGNGIGGEDEDDHDQAQVALCEFDLALTKVVSDPSDGIVAVGDTITFDIEVTNQGDVNAYFIEVCDSIPASLDFDASLNPGWTGSGSGYCLTLDSGTGSILGTRGLEPDSSITVSIILIVNATGLEMDNWVNIAEITQGENVNGIDGGDIDSNPDDEFVNDAGGNPGGNSDNTTGGDGSGDPGDDDPFTDEDDNDPALFFVEDPVIGIAKRLDNVEVLPDNSYNVTLIFQVENLGNVPISNVQVTDDLVATFGSNTVYSIVSLSSSEFIVNFPGYDGDGDINMLSGNDVLQAGDGGNIILVVNVTAQGTYLNNATVTGDSPLGNPVDDNSEDGPDPDPNGDGDPSEESDTEIDLSCFLDIVCPTAIDTITVEASTDWCQAAINLPPTGIITCAGAPDTLIEFMISGAGAVDANGNVLPTDVWITGSPVNLEFFVGITNVITRVSIPGLQGVNAVSCDFVVEVLDKQAPTMVCQDVNVDVNGNCDFTLTPDLVDAGTYDNCTEAPNPPTPGAASLVITGVIDGPLSGGQPKAMELYAISDIPDLSLYGVGSANNAGGTDGEEFTFPAVAVSAGTYIYVSNETTQFTNWFGFAPDYTSSALSINGDDAMELFFSGNLVDVFGEQSGSAITNGWNYQDGWAYRVDMTGPDATFDINDWTFSGANALDNQINNTLATTPFPTATYMSGAGLILTGVIDGPLSGGTPKAIEFYATTDIPDLSAYGFGSANNGGGSDGEEFTFPAVPLAAGTYIYVATEATQFTNWFGFAPDYTDGFAASINGDDAIELFYMGGVIDVFGDPNVDGSGQPWEYADGWAKRIMGGPDNPFVLGNWVFSGPNALDFEVNNNTAANPFPAAASQVLSFLISLDGPNGPFFSSIDLDLTNYLNSPFTVWLQATDQAGNVGICAAEVTLNDATPPSLTCPDDMDINTEPFICSGIVPNLMPNAVTDNCLVVDTLYQQPAPGLLFGSEPGDTVNVILTVVDADGNTQQCTTTLTLVDNVPPVFVNCPDSVVVGNDPDECYANTNWSIPVAEDNCGPGGVTVVQIAGPFPGTVVPVGTVFDVAYEAIDGSDNRDTCEFTVYVLDTQDPEFIVGMPQDVTVQCDAVPVPFVVDSTDVWDNCTDPGDILIDFDETSTQSGDVDSCDNYNYLITRTWTLTDSSGNTASYTRYITVVDTEAPTFVVPGDLTLECDESQDPDDTGRPTDVEDNCAPFSALTIEFSDSTNQGIDPNFCQFYTYTIFRTWTITDPCGNANSQVQMIEVEDTEAPLPNCNDITVQLDSNGMATLTPDEVNMGTIDNCASFENIDFDISDDVFNCDNIGDNMVMLTATDPCGNSSACLVTVTVEDNIQPSVECPTDITINLDPGACEQIVSFVPTVAWDNCGFEITSDPPTGSPFPIGNNPVTITITDDGGNTDSCTFNIIVNEYDPGTNTLACNDFVTLALDGNCQGEINADLVLEGNIYGCYDDYIIIVETMAGDTLDPIVTIDNLGDTLVVTVIDPETGNFCSTLVLVVDNLVPIVQCPDSITVQCNANTDPSVTGNPILLSCEPSVDIDYFDQFNDFGMCADPRAEIIRTFTITDEGNNSVVCVQIITIESFDLADVVFPDDYDIDNAFNCEDVVNDPSLTEPENTGFPTVNGEIVGSTSGFCMISHNYTDEIFWICLGSYEILRTWKVRDMCEPVVAGENPLEYIQVIKVLDLEGPEIVGPADVTFSAAADCSIDYVVPAPEVIENCSNVNTVTIIGPDGTLYDPGEFVFDLGLGDNIFTYLVTDECDNMSEPYVHTVTVEDNDPPIAICDQQTSVSVGQDGLAQVCWPTIDDGSYDNCGILAYAVKRDDDPSFIPFDSCAVFSCDDVGNTVTVRMRVYDIIGTFTENDPIGRFNECEVQVTVEDNLPPVVVCPPSVTLNCFDDYTYVPNVSDNPQAGPPTYRNGELIGYYTQAFDNCEVAEVTITESGQPDNCGEATITRIITAVDVAGNSISCVQFLTLLNGDPFVINDTDCNNLDPNDGVEWPCDLTLNTCFSGSLDPDSLLADYPASAFPVLNEDICDLVGLDWDDTTLPITPPGCIKILRTWTIIDWCQPDNNYPLGYVTYTYVQEIKVLESAAPTINSACEDVTICGYDADCEPFNTNGDDALILDAEDDCTEQGDLVISYAIDLFNDNVTGYDVFGTGDDANGEYMIGTHKICWTVEDGCGNVTQCCYTFTIEDCKQPTPVCLNGLATVVMPSSGMVELCADYFENGDSYDNCTPYSELLFSFSASTSDTCRIFDCSQLDSQLVEIWVTDEYGNQDFCETYVVIQDPEGVCGTLFDVAGVITTEEDLGVEDVTVTLNTGNGPAPTSMTNITGGYAFFNLPEGGNYEIDPSKDINWLNGVTVSDLVLLKNHLLALYPLDSPYKIIAADANHDEEITLIDLVMIQQLILYNISEIPGNESWRFVDADHNFQNPANPWFPAPFPEERQINSLSQDELFENFIGVKIGDLNNTASPNSLVNNDTRNAVDNVVFVTEEQTVKAGDVIEVTFAAENFDQVSGYQFTLDFDKLALDFVDVRSAEVETIGDANFGLRFVEEGFITAAWASEVPSITEGAQLFTLVFEAKEDGMLSDWLSVSSQYTMAEAVRLKPLSGTHDKYDVRFRFDAEEDVIKGGEFALYQNQPNPFQDMTVVGFNLPKASTGTLKIYDTTGKVIKLIKGDFNKGYNAITFNRTELGATGILYYHLETDTHSATKKMIIIE